METKDMLNELAAKARKDESLRQSLLETQKAKEPLSAFCKLAVKNGYDICEMDVIEAGESMYAAIKRSTNGGGENSPLLEYEDDLYEMFMASIE